MTYQSALEHVRSVKAKLGNHWNAIRPEDAARMVVQNRFKTGLDIAKYTASIMRRDMAEYDADNSKYTQSLWLLAWIYRPAKDDCQQKILWHYQQTLHLSIRLDGCCIAF